MSLSHIANKLLLLLASPLDSVKRWRLVLTVHVPGIYNSRYKDLDDTLIGRSMPDDADVDRRWQSVRGNVNWSLK